jgi:predicted nucleic acid-binding protein
MAWVVDTSVVLDIHTGDPSFEPGSTASLQIHLAEGLLVCPITFVEIGPSFGGDVAAARSFLNEVSISSFESWTSADTEMAHFLWNRYQFRRRQVNLVKRPVADVLIAAFARRFQGIITRNGDDFRAIDPELIVVEP